MSACTMTNVAWEAAFRSGTAYDDPFREVELDVIFTDPAGAEHRVPAFWSGEQTWRVRYASPLAGRHTYRTACSTPADKSLHGREGVLEIVPYEGDNPLWRRGPLRVSEDRRYLEHADGTPFLWLGDTWWMGLCRRLRWPDEFRALTADRVTKGYTVIQIVAGLYPDQPAFDERADNECGYPWTAEWGSIRPDYYDAADLRIEALAAAGLVPCIVGCWGYYLPWLGVDNMKRHWRYLVARYGALPVVWCLAGEGSMPWYLSETREQDQVEQRAGWTELGQYVRAIDPFGRPITIHPSQSARRTVDDPTVLDFDMLQTGHGDRRSLGNTIRLAQEAYATEPPLPVINGEVCYEGIGEACREEVQRLMFWASILSGAKGFTYGANGIWQFNRPDQPHGPSPHGMAWGHRPWQEAMHLPGSGQLGLAKRLLERYEWWRIEPHPDWIDDHADPDNPDKPLCAGIPGELRLIFVPASRVWGPLPVIRGLEPGAVYRAFLWSGLDGSEVALGEARGGPDGEWLLPFTRWPIFQDWLVVLERHR